MSLLTLSWRNIQRNFRLYTIYFVSMVMGVIIQYTFSSLIYHQDILDALKNKENFQIGVTIASVVVFLFIIFFILYANSFFMRQRKKEFGMYLLFGLTERQIAVMVFYETLGLAAISLVIGILSGGLLSKFFGMLLMNLMQYDQVISFSFPPNAMISTAGLFLFLVIIITIQSFLNINRVQLVELFHAKAQTEKPIQPSTSLALISILFLAGSAVLIAQRKESTVWTDYAKTSLIAVSIGIIGGTYLFFRQFSGWLLQRISQSKRYFRGNTMLWTSSLRFLVRSNTWNLTFISLFSTILIMLIGFVAINYSVQFESVGRNLPNDFAFQVQDAKTNQRVDQLIRNSPHQIKYQQKLTALQVKPLSKRELAFENPEYYAPGVLLVAERAYNQLVASRKDPQQVNLQGTESVSLSQGTDTPKRFAEQKQPEFTISTTKQSVQLNITEQKDYALLSWATDPVRSMKIKPAVIVISDDLYGKLQRKAPHFQVQIYQVENAGDAVDLSKKLYKLIAQNPQTYYSAFADTYSIQIEGASLALFSASFLAIIALFSLASVIYFKQLREATEQQKQYAILRKIGVASGVMIKVIRKQLLFVFFPPLLLGMLHSWLVLKYYILDSVKDFPELTLITGIIYVAYLLIYVLFYLSSTKIYYRIANKQYT